MQCLICGKEAHDITRADFDGIAVSCPDECGHYTVASRYEQKLSELDYEDRKAVLAKAKRFARYRGGDIPSINATAF